MGTIAGDGVGLDALLALLERTAALRRVEVRPLARAFLPAAKAWWDATAARGVKLGAITAGRLADQRNEHRNFSDVLAHLDASGTAPAPASPAAPAPRAISPVLPVVAAPAPPPSDRPAFLGGGRA